MSSEELIKVIIKENKVAEVLQLIEQQKKEIITTYESLKPKKSKLA